jgi:RNA polymerase sigma-70 factor (ECF subfamily)
MKSARDSGMIAAHPQETRMPAAAGVAVRAAIVDSYDRLRNYLQRRFNSAADAEEVLHVFVLKALERSADVRDAESVRGWLSKVLSTTIADFHRQTSRNKTREMPLSAELSDRIAVDPDVWLENAACECLHIHLHSLKLEHAEVIRRLDLGGESREAVAADLGVTVNNLTVRLYRARQALKERLESKCVICREDSFWACRCGDARDGRLA